MFRRMAEDVVNVLLKKRILSAGNREICIYAVEVLLLNFSLLLTLFVISMLLQQLLHFLCYIFFFIPLRVFSGGYHSKKSETCFILSSLSFLGAMLVLKYNSLLYENTGALVCTLVIMVLIVLFSPIENINHPLTQAQKHRNKMYVRVIVLIDFTLLVIFINNRMAIASGEIIFVLLNGITLIIGKVKHIGLRAD